MRSNIPAAHRAASPSSRDLKRRSQDLDWRCILYLQLRACRFVATSVLIVWGVMVSSVFVLGGFSLDGMMWQLDNLSSRYLAADPERRLQFQQILVVAHIALAVVVLAVRLRARAPSSGKGWIAR